MTVNAFSALEDILDLRWGEILPYRLDVVTEFDVPTNLLHDKFYGSFTLPRSLKLITRDSRGNTMHKLH